MRAEIQVRASEGRILGETWCLARDSAAGGLSSGAVRPPDLPGEASRRRARAQPMAGSTNRLGTDRWFEFPIRIEFRRWCAMSITNLENDA